MLQDCWKINKIKFEKRSAEHLALAKHTSKYIQLSWLFFVLLSSPWKSPSIVPLSISYPSLQRKSDWVMLLLSSVAHPYWTDSHRPTSWLVGHFYVQPIHSHFVLGLHPQAKPLAPEEESRQVTQEETRLLPQIPTFLRGGLCGYWALRTIWLWSSWLGKEKNPGRAWKKMRGKGFKTLLLLV